MRTTTATQRGFTLIEIMVAAAVFAVAAFVLVGLIYEYNLGSKRLSATQHARADIAHLLDQWESDQSSADAVFIPDKDVLGADNTANAHEIDFYAKDASNRPYYWAYYYDAAAHALQRYDYPNPGASASKDGTLLTAITQFAPSLHAISEVSNPSSPIYMPIFASARDYDVPLGAGNKVVGGTHIVHVDLATAQERIPVELEAGGAPSGFTVVLNYTPMPRPNLQVWPPAVQLPVSGGSLGALAYDGKLRDPGAWINEFLGGGIAQAAVAGCGVGQGRAMDGAGWTSSDVLANAHDPLTASPYTLTTDASGCITGPGGANIIANEPGYDLGFVFRPGATCAGSVSNGLWNGVGPTAWTQTAGSSKVTCTASVQDNNPTPQATPVAVQVLEMCSGVAVGASCTWPSAVNQTVTDEGGPCVPVGSSDTGSPETRTYYGARIGARSIGSGTLVTDASTGDLTFTRTAPGTVSVEIVLYTSVIPSVCGQPSVSKQVVRTMTVN